MRDEISRLVELGGLPGEDADLETIAAVEVALGSLAAPATLQEALAACKLFPPDGSSCFGTAWTLLHFIETAPGWVAAAADLEGGSEWIDMLKARVERATRLDRGSDH